MATPLMSVGGLLSVIERAKFCDTFLGTVGNELGLCLELGLIKVTCCNTGVPENTEPKFMGAVVTMGVFNEADAAAKEADSVATLGRGGGIIGLLFVSNIFFGEGGPSSDELESNVESKGSGLI